MPRRSDPARILSAKREGTRQRLISTGNFPERVDELRAAYGVLPEVEGRPWDGEAANRWVTERRR